jgi:hypothetical protein
MAEPHLIQPIDLKRFYSSLDGTLLYDRAAVDREDHCYYRAPLDFPGYVRFQRIVKAKPDGTEAAKSYEPVGVTMEVDCFTFGVKVFIRIGLDGTLKVFAQDADGTEKLTEYTNKEEA